MIRISSISTQLEALIGDDPDENGADTALIVCDRSADLYGYATKISKEPVSYTHLTLPTICSV